VDGAAAVERRPHRGGARRVGGPAAPTLWVPAGPGAPRWQELLDLLAAPREAQTAAAGTPAAAVEPGGRPADERRGACGRSRRAARSPTPAPSTASGRTARRC
jgi:hypothetical protein